MAYLKSVTLKIECCTECPHCKTGRTFGAGCADDFFCKKKKDSTADHGYKVIVGYVEWPSEMPKKGQIPTWCPLKKKGVA